MRILILSGFLGSGKTSLLLQLARHIAGGAADATDIKVVILENEVGSQGVDDRLLKSGSFEVENLFSGCACCTVGDELVRSVADIERDFKPEWMILETTGLAYPGLIQENLKEALGKDSSVCTVVDAARWKRLRVPMEALLSGQIRFADTVLVNKIDLVSEDVLEECDADIRKMNPSAAIIHTSAESGVEAEVWERVLGIKYD